MAKKITYLNKVDVNEVIGDAVEWWRGSDANEVKDVVNSLAVEVEGLTTASESKLTESEVDVRINAIAPTKEFLDLKIKDVNNRIDNLNQGWRNYIKADSDEIVWNSFADINSPQDPTWSVTYNNLGILYGKAEVLTSKSKDDTYKDREFMPKEAIQELVGVEGGHSVFNVTKIQQTGGTMRSTRTITVIAGGTRDVYTLVGDERNANGINVTIQNKGVFELRKVNNVWNDFIVDVLWDETASGNPNSDPNYRENQYETRFIISVENNVIKITEGVEFIRGQNVAAPYGSPTAKRVWFTSLEFISDAGSIEYTLANSVDITAPSNTAGDENAKSDVRIIEIDDIITPKYPKGQTQEVGGGEVILPDYGYSFMNVEITWESPAQNQSIVETDLMAKGTDGSEFIISSLSTPLSNRNGAIIKSNMNYTIVNGVDVASLFLRFKLIEGDWPKLSGIKIGHITK